MARNNKRQTRRAAPAAASTTSSTVSGRMYEREFNPDYSPVIMDLKRIGILAGSFIVILVALSFFLN